VYYVGRNKYLSCITTVRRRSAGGDPDRPGDSFRPTGPPAQAEGVPFLTGQKAHGKRRTTRHSLRHRLRPRRGPRIIGPGLFLLS